MGWMKSIIASEFRNFLQTNEWLWIKTVESRQDFIQLEFWINWESEKLKTLQKSLCGMEKYGKCRKDGNSRWEVLLKIGVPAKLAKSLKNNCEEFRPTALLKMNFFTFLVSFSYILEI